MGRFLKGKKLDRNFLKVFQTFPKKKSLKISKFSVEQEAGSSEMDNLIFQQEIVLRDSLRGWRNLRIEVFFKKNSVFPALV